MLFTELPRLEPSTRAIAISDAVFPRRAGVKGSISKPEARFVMTALEMCDARTVVEVGVASGGSTLYMLAMLNERPGFRRLFAFDLETRYFGDASKPVGYLALDSEFNLDGRLTVEGGAFAPDIGPTIGRASSDLVRPIDFAFIDGDHRHPWAAIDLLFLLPLMREGGIVVFHDINLLFVTGATGASGPMRLFSCPFSSRFIVPGDRPNIGAMHVIDREKMIDIAIAALAEGWETRPDPQMSARLAAALANGPLASRASELTPYFQ
jgi:predicted O-methyltransferase YrrM